MLTIKLLVSFAILLVILLVFKKPLWMSGLCGCAAALILFLVPVGDAAGIIAKSLTSKQTLEVVAVIYLVNVLQFILQKHGSLASAEEAMLNLFNNRRLITIFSPILLGLLPAPNAAVLSAPIVQNATDGYLEPEDQAYLTSYYRHIPESALPLYPGLLLALGVTGLSASKFLIAVIPVAAVGILAPYFITIRKHVPSDTGKPASTDKKADAKKLFLSLWPIFLLIALVVGFDLTTSLCTLAICVVLFFLYKIDFKDVPTMLKKSFNVNMILSTAVLMIYKDILAYTGVVNELTDTFSKLSMPLFIIYALLMFVGGATGLGNAMIAVAFPIAFASIPGSGIPLLILLMSFSHAAAQLSPTHLCLDIAARYFKIDLKDLILRTIPVTAIYCAFSILYYLILTSFA